MKLVTVDNICLRQGSRTVLEDLSLQVSAGDRIVIQGDNGAGKTSLLKAILGLIPLLSGQISLDGHLVGSRDWQRVRQQAAWVPQNGVLHRFPIAAEETVAVGLAGRRMSRREKISRVDKAMEAAGAAHLKGRCFHRLSGGEQQRLSIARCLAQEARLLLLDEPAAALDSRSRERLLELIDRLPNVSIIAVTHEKDLFTTGNWQLLQLEGGRLC